jgi:hypothetical protein
MKKHFLLWLLLPFLHFDGYTQQCTPAEQTAKYWQYRKQFNRHFIAIDRKPDGCIGNGITDPDQPADEGHCGISFLTGGYSLPATSIVMQPNGTRGVVDDRANMTGPFYDPECNDGTGDRFNHLEMGSETPHQLGWYLVTLATEYELLRVSGETAEMQKTLEEIFLALQAYKRLDMRANCMAKERYDEITNDFEVDRCNNPFNEQPYCSLCRIIYQTGQHIGLSMPCFKDCNFTPDLSGTSGFFLREDATQKLETILTDNSEDMWNIDLISSDNAFG